MHLLELGTLVVTIAQFVMSGPPAVLLVADS